MLAFFDLQAFHMPFGEYQPCYRLKRFLVVRLAKEVVVAGERFADLCAGSNHSYG
jgi:hypothetical protein